MPTSSRRRRRRGNSIGLGFPHLVGGCALVVVVGAILQHNSPEAQNYRAQQAMAQRELTAADRISAEITAKSKINEAQAKYQEQQRQIEADIAHRRYTSGCTMLTARDTDPAGYEYQAIALAEGVTYLDANSGGRLLDGQEICDDRGMTGVFRGGEIVEVARATDPKVWNQRFEDALGWHELARRSKVGE